MLSSLLSSLRSSASNDAQKQSETPATRRVSQRRAVDRCVTVMYGQTFPVENWSFGGILIGADDRMFGMKQDVDMTIKFKLRNTIVDVDIKGVVVRKSQGRIAIQFEPLTQTIRRNFQQVIDDHVAGEFANSQA